ncbi:MAG: universal stress protein [Desulfomonile tiedjei]|nr:universal stress protein [Desulfomonile tiedjei]
MAVKKILFCTDFSENSRPARDYAVQFAKLFGAELLVLNVVNIPVMGQSAWTGGLPVDMSAVEQQIRAAAEKQVELLAEECRRELPEVMAVSRPGIPTAAEIVRFADQEGVDLIVLGTHGWTGIKHLVMGSTAENVVRTANCPVLTVRVPGD